MRKATYAYQGGRPQNGYDRRHQASASAGMRAANIGSHGSKASKIAPATQDTVCQRCEKRGHYTSECKNPPVYKARPTRTQQLLNPKKQPKLLGEADSFEAPKKEGVAAQILAENAQKRDRARGTEESVASSSGSEDSDSDSESGSQTDSLSDSGSSRRSRSPVRSGNGDRGPPKRRLHSRSRSRSPPPHSRRRLDAQRSNAYRPARRAPLVTSESSVIAPVSAPQPAQSDSRRFRSEASTRPPPLSPTGPPGSPPLAGRNSVFLDTMDRSGRDAPLGPPPAYARAVTRVYKRDLRPLVLFFSAITALWLVIVGASSFRFTGQSGETAKMRLLDIICGIMAFALVAMEVWGFVAAFTQRLSLVKTYAFLSFVAAATALGLEVVEIVEHFVTKTDQINQCIANNQTTDSPGTLTGGSAFTSGDVQSDCQDDWNRYTWYCFAWLIVAIIWALLTTAISVAYYHQLSNPANNRMAPSAAYAMNPYAQDPPFQPPTFNPPGYYPGNDLPAYTGDGKVAPPEKNPLESDGLHIEHANADSDLGAGRYDETNLSEVTLHAGEGGREREGRV